MHVKRGITLPRRHKYGSRSGRSSRLKGNEEAHQYDLGVLASRVLSKKKAGRSRCGVESHSGTRTEAFRQLLVSMEYEKL